MGRKGGKFMHKMNILFERLFLAYLAVIFIILLLSTWICVLPSVKVPVGFVVCFVGCGATEIMITQEMQDLRRLKKHYNG